ncbi:hypothetical protein BD779DRAFT_1674859 [Infundibulicybe gibba]|nr:hypothetical protein BD779DRAFT_1674859 [Infundibulicybe gibba]
MFSKIISIACQCTSQAYVHMFPLVLASVSQRWRAFVLDFAPIWTALYIALDVPAPTAGVQTFLRRSRSLPLNIVLYHPNAGGDGFEAIRVSNLMRTLRPQINRWRSLKLYLNQSTALQTIIYNFTGVAGSLEELVIHSSVQGVDRNAIVGSVFGMVLPAIRHLQVSGEAAHHLIRNITWIEEMPLISLRLTNGVARVSTDDVFTFLRDVSAESTLELLEIDGGLFEPHKGRPKCSMYRLRKVRFKRCFYNLATGLSAAMLSAPNLETAEVFLPAADQAFSPSTSDFLYACLPFSPNDSGEHRFPKLRTFRFVGPFALGDYLVGIEPCERLAVKGVLDISKTLAQLGKFHDDVGRAGASLHKYLPTHTSPPTEGWFCSSLLSLEIDRCDGLNPSQLRGMLAARQGATGPGLPINTISSVIVYDEQGLPDDDRSWFEANLDVFQWIRV